MKNFSFPVDLFPNLVTLDQGPSVASNKNAERLAGQSAVATLGLAAEQPASIVLGTIGILDGCRRGQQSESLSAFPPPGLDSCGRFRETQHSL
jgi:hypothetical protein